MSVSLYAKSRNIEFESWKFPVGEIGVKITGEIDPTELHFVKSKCQSNVSFGAGSYTYQYNSRDTLGMAVKATFGVFESEDEIEKLKAKNDEYAKIVGKLTVVFCCSDK